MSADDYERVRKVGEGGFGSVYLVKHRRTRMVACLKVVSFAQFDGADDADKQLQQALDEARIGGALHHPNIVCIHECVSSRRALHIVMEYCGGGDLAALYKKRRGRAITEPQLLEWTLQLCSGVAHIHSHNILHRDLKAENVFIGAQHTLKIGDFGIAKALEHTLAQAQTKIGTPYYLSPELCADRPYAQSSDIWALGVLLYELAALAYPFQVCYCIMHHSISSLLSQARFFFLSSHRLIARHNILLCRRHPHTRSRSPSLSLLTHRGAT
jgi:NIMA (never in mitosis gene a)-related kinase